jgi:hypothetical protein
MNQPAFPFVAEDETGMMINMGMDLRDYFAGKAMQSIILKEWDNYYNTSPHEDNYREITLCLDVAYEIADAMMEVRKCK